MFEALTVLGFALVRSRRGEAARVFLSEAWSRGPVCEAGLDFARSQDNHSLSRNAGTPRGMCYLMPTTERAWLAHCTRVNNWDSAADARRGPPTEKRSFDLRVAAEERVQISAPKGFFDVSLTPAPHGMVVSKIDHFDNAAADEIVGFHVSGIAPAWPLHLPPRLPEKDREGAQVADRSDSLGRRP